ncbi:hypothetical protein B0H13DRAFT_2418026 [Mycena leptocephala]|nr:hypothetical protein B0H13DRAFT_2418026 [Mycena leptocephala]
MVKPSDITKLEGAENYWTWKPDAASLLLADGLWNAVDPSVPVPNGAVQMRNWASENLKAHGILFLTLSQAVKDKINNAGIGINGHLLWVTLESYYTMADPATRSILMSQFHTISHDLSRPVDAFLQAVVTAEHRLTAIAVSFLTHMVQDKILSGLSSAYSPIITLLQLESPQRDRADSVIKAARATQDIYDANQGGEFAAAHLTRHSRRSDSSPHSHSSAGKEFDWTNTKNRTDVCYRCGLPGHFAQYCVSVMPEDVRRRIIRNRERQAQLAEEESSDSEHGAANVAATATTNSHIAAAIFDLPTELHIDTMDPDVRESWLSTLGNGVRPIPQHFAHTAVPTNIDPGPSPPSPTLTASSVSSTPTKKKNKNKKKKKSTTVNKIQSAFEGMLLKEADEVDEAEYSM